MSRTFYAQRDCTVYVTEYVEIEADSFEEAFDRIESGFGTVTDESEYDRDHNGVEEVTCYDCDRDEDDCECDSNCESESESVFAELGL